MDKVRTFIILVIFILLSVGSIMNIIRHRKEEKAAKEEKKRKRSPFAQQMAEEPKPESMESLLQTGDDKLEEFSNNAEADTEN